MKRKTEKTKGFLPCPFCGKIPVIVVEDDEGNTHSEEGYESNPWSGLWYAIRHVHDGECLIADGKPDTLEDAKDIGDVAFSTREECVQFWNEMITIARKRLIPNENGSNQ